MGPPAPVLLTVCVSEFRTEQLVAALMGLIVVLFPLLQESYRDACVKQNSDNQIRLANLSRHINQYH